MRRTGVSWHLSAAHRGPNGVLHGHTWTVAAWFPSGEDAVALQGMLKEVIGTFDHGTLPATVSLGEDLAEFIGEALPCCLLVRVDRVAEGIFAEWSPDA